MTEREKLQLQCEDALFALLMNDAACLQGQQALAENKKLQADPTLETPASANRHCRRTIRRYTVKHGLYEGTVQTFPFFQKVAVAVCLVTLSASAAFALLPEFRVGTLNLITEVTDKATNIYMTEDTDTETNAASPPTMSEELQIGWLPDGYELVSTDSVTDFQLSYRFESTTQDALTHYIDISKIDGDGTGSSIDTEDAYTEYITINGMKTLYIEYIAPKQGSAVYIFDTEKALFIDVLAEGITRDELIKIAESIHY